MAVWINEEVMLGMKSLQSLQKSLAAQLEMYHLQKIALGYTQLYSVRLQF